MDNYCKCMLGSSNKKTNAILVGRSSTVNKTGTSYTLLNCSSSNTNYATSTSPANKLTFQKKCKIMIQYEVTASGGSNGCSIKIYHTSNGDTTTWEKSDNGTSIGLPNGFNTGIIIRDVIKNDIVYAQAKAGNTAGGSGVYYTVYALEIEE